MGNVMIMTLKKTISQSVLLLLLTHSTTVTHSQSISETKQSIHQLDHKIKNIQTHLAMTYDQQQQLQKKLLETERLIKDNEDKLLAIQAQMPIKKNEIEQLEQEIAALNKEFEQLQALLTQQIQARYKHPTNQALGWVLKNPAHSKTDQVLTYYHYVIRSHQQTLAQIKKTQFKLHQQQERLQQELQTFMAMQNKWQGYQQQLQHHKNHHQSLLNALRQHIDREEKNLSQYQRNRDNLSKILRTLNQQSVIQTRHSMTKMKSKLPLPVQVEPGQIHKLNQGIILYSTMGASVHTVYPGKVVFSEWLNGYGLLMIIDHGWGLMTLYANNHHLLKHKGDLVNQGEQIATVGQNGISKQPGLYFEVRKQGKAIAPMDWLSKVALAKK
ncbi:MAG TPA: peptidoglycan DD-metalloendopeptidase family protein [Legionellaceae bacterium]|nr:peptidoglycan DD-metalloendopeptidase family protein [Legionellaceae bacterium]